MRKFCVAVLSLISLISVFQAKAVVEGTPAYLTSRTAKFNVVTNNDVRALSSFTVYFKSATNYDLKRVSGRLQNETNVVYTYTPATTFATIDGTSSTTVTNIKRTVNSTNITTTTTSVTNSFGLTFTAPLGGSFTNQITIGIQTNITIFTTSGPIISPELSSETKTNNQFGNFSVTDLTFDFNQDGQADFLWQNFTRITKTNVNHVTEFVPVDTGGTNFAVWELPTNITSPAVITHLNTNITAKLSEVETFTSLFPTNFFELPTKLGNQVFKSSYPISQVVGQADFDGNGVIDLVWQGRTNQVFTNGIVGTTNFSLSYFATNQPAVISILMNVTNDVINLTNRDATYRPDARLAGLGNFTGSTAPTGFLQPDFLFVTNITFGTNITRGTNVTTKLVSTNYQLFAVTYNDMFSGAANPEMPIVSTNRQGLVTNSISTAFGVAGIADLNGDGWSDIIFTNHTKALTVWFMKGTTNTSKVVVTNGVPSLAIWKFQGIADFDHDGHPDFVYRSPVTDQILINFMNGGNGLHLRNTARIKGPSSEWNIVAPK